MEWFLFLVAIFGLFFAGVIKGVTGLGYTSCALPFLVPAVGLKMAIPLLILPAVLSNIQVVLATDHLRETIGRFGVMYLAMLPGIAVGLFALNRVNISLSTAILGGVILVYSIFAVLKPRWTVGPSMARALQFPVGALNGFLTGLTGSQVMPLFPYIMSLGLDSVRIVQAVNLAVTLSSFIMAVGVIAVGIMTPVIALWSILAVVPASAGVFIGGRIRRHIPEQQFRQLVLSLFFLMGCGLISASIR
jgi:uncharacterized protein